MQILLPLIGLGLGLIYVSYVLSGFQILLPLVVCSNCQQFSDQKELSNAQSHWFVVQFDTMSSQVSTFLLEEGVFIYIFEAMQDFVGLNKIAPHSSSFQGKEAQLLKPLLVWYLS